MARAAFSRPAAAVWRVPDRFRIVTRVRAVVQPGGRATLEIVQSGADGDFGFWTGFQDSEAKLEGKDKLVPMRLRVTELYSRRNGDWKLSNVTPTRPHDCYEGARPLLEWRTNGFIPPTDFRCEAAGRSSAHPHCLERCIGSPRRG
jgi:hypothetical protein